jgi:hypothetical protein
MALAIDLDNQVARVRDEIGDVIAHWRLPPKAETGESMGFHMTPQQGFGARHRAS